MKATITLDALGRLVLPKAMRERLHLQAGTRLKAEVVLDRIELTPEPEESVRLVRKGGRLVVGGNGPCTEAVGAVKGARRDRDAQVARRLRVG